MSFMIAAQRTLAGVREQTGKTKKQNAKAISKAE
jgi:hypothetical protein